jgi:hypothetical protein
MATDTAYTGQARPDSGSSQFNAIKFIFKQLLGQLATATIVEVVGVGSAGGLADVFVDVQPLVNQMAGGKFAVPHGILYGLPAFRLQAGGSAVILDPAIGDIGLAVFADRDISSVVNNRAQSNPGSFRRFDMSDGMFIGGFVNEEPTQYIRISDAGGISLFSPMIVNVNAPGLAVAGAITATGNITAGQGSGDQVTLQTHKHPTAATGSPSSPTPGS